MEPFGSFVSELFTRWGDLDVSIEFSKGSYISSYGRKHTLDVLRDVMRAMRQRGRFIVFSFSSAYVFYLYASLVMHITFTCLIGVSVSSPVSHVSVLVYLALRMIINNYVCLCFGV